ncbi:MFS transporter [Nonomuraea sp. NPDC050643]|uniref:MFS transporter n=1 Tax=Nonomuraea sp. NPDC050643 TaxID=3155660 RepID=UPI0033D49E76
MSGGGSGGSPGDGPGGRVRRLVMAAVLPIGFLGFFEVSVIPVIAPAIRQDLESAHSATQLVILAYTLPFALLVVAGGRLADLWGIRRVFLLGVGGFAAASLLAAASWDLPSLLVARGAQGMGAALMTPQVLTAIRFLLPAARRGRAFAMYALVACLATACGPLAGGFLTHSALGWRIVFLIEVPVGLAALAVGAWCLPGPAARPGRPGIDVRGTLLAGVGVLLLVYPLTSGTSWAWALLPLAAVPLVIFVRHERRVERGGGQPLVSLGLFRLPVFTAGLSVTVLVSVLLGAFFLLFVILLQDGLAYDGPRLGQAITPWAIGTAVGAALTSRLTRRFGRRALLAGAVLMTLGMGAFAWAVPMAEGMPAFAWALPMGEGVPALAGAVPVAGATSVPLALALAAAGIGTSLVATPALDLVMSSVPAGEAGGAAGMFTTFRQIGGAVGVAVAGAFFYALLGDPVSAGRAAYVRAFSITVLLDVVLCLIILGLIFMLPRSAEPAELTEPVTRPVALLFPGQGAQAARMGAGLYGHEPVFTATMDTAFALMGPEGDRLREEWLRERPSDLFDDVTRAQPLLYAVNCALGRMVMHRGVRPAALLGHSVGEMAAATLAGVFSFEEGLRLMRDRVEQIKDSPPGGMLAVAGSPGDLAPYLNGQVVVGAVNGPRQTLLAGPSGPLGEVRERLVADGFTCRPTRALQAFHSPALSAHAAASVPAWHATELRPPELPLYSAYRPGRLPDADVLAPEFWAGQPAEPVLFRTALDLMLEDGDFLLVEAGPGQGLCALARRHPAVVSGRSAVIGLLPARSGDDSRDREAVDAAFHRISAEGHPLDRRP